MKINIAKIKGWGKDENGMEKFLYLTDSQVRTIGEMRNDPNQRYCFVKIGKLVFSPMDVQYIEEQDKVRYDIPSYALKRLEQEENCALPEGGLEIHG